MEKKQYLECGKIVNTHGVKGAVKIEPWCDSPEDFACLKRVFLKDAGEMTEMTVLNSSVFKQFVISEIKGVGDFDTALSLKNKILYAKREDFKLEDGDYFIADLIGLSVIDVNNGTVYGTLKDVVNRGASDIYVVETPDGERMMPAVDEFVKRIDLDNGIFVELIEGLLD